MTRSQTSHADYTFEFLLSSVINPPYNDYNLSPSSFHPLSQQWGGGKKKIFIIYIHLILILNFKQRTQVTHRTGRNFHPWVKETAHKGTAYLHTDWPIFYRNPIPYPLKCDAWRKGGTAMILRNPPSGNTRLRLHDLSFYSWYARRTLVSKTMNRAPVTIAKWSTCASTWTRPDVAAFKRYVRPSRVYLPTCICLTLTSTPFSPDFAARWKKKARERERGRREEDLYAQWQPVIPVAATGSALLVYFVESLVAKESIHEKWW